MTKWIMVVDDDTANLQMAGHILSKNHMRVTALKSGQLLLDYVANKGVPDLILLDIKMPEMDGFETLRQLRELEKEKGIEEIPVIFLTADEERETESRGFEVGVADFIRKPFHPDVLMRRIDHIVSKQKEMISLKSEAATDKLTGLLNKAAVGTALAKACSVSEGSLLMIDLDSFKLVNDVYGHEMGDKVLIRFSEILKNAFPEGSVCGRIGGDEFAAFVMGVTEEWKIATLSEELNSKIVAVAKELMGEEMNLPLGVSMGVIYVPKHGNDYGSLMKLADECLYAVKKNGKHGYSIYSTDVQQEKEGFEVDLKAISEILGERTVPDVALQLDMEAFAYVYRYVIRYIVRHQIDACKILFTLKPFGEGDEKGYHDACDEFGNCLRDTLRKSDILMRNRHNQYFVFLTDVREDSTEKVIRNIMRKWHVGYPDRLLITYETELMGNDSLRGLNKDKCVIIVDDDMINLQVAGKALSSSGIRSIALQSGKALLDYVREHDVNPDLILLDINMPNMDGFETLVALREKQGEIAKVPVIFLTADESTGAESRGLSLGAVDFIRKPFVPDILTLRVNHILELTKLQRQLSSEVERKTRENRNLFLHVVESLASAIDAKDNYTNGHSGRVAEYSKEIAKRAGYSERDQEEIYIMGLLHDVGKIGVPDAVINKPGRLTDEEFEMIKKHPGMGAQILENIKENPNLAVCAKRHHERYDGTGYPGGLAGDQIPELARIISVADSYDAMSSNRSYRGALPQDVIRSEIERERGRQFDPRFANIMLEIIDEDKDYSLREK